MILRSVPDISHWPSEGHLFNSHSHGGFENDRLVDTRECSLAGNCCSEISSTSHYIGMKPSLINKS